MTEQSHAYADDQSVQVDKCLVCRQYPSGSIAMFLFIHHNAEECRTGLIEISGHQRQKYVTQSTARGLSLGMSSEVDINAALPARKSQLVSMTKEQSMRYLDELRCSVYERDNATTPVSANETGHSICFVDECHWGRYLTRCAKIIRTRKISSMVPTVRYSLRPDLMLSTSSLMGTTPPRACINDYPDDPKLSIHRSG